MNLVKNVKIYILLFSSCLLGIIILGGLYYEKNSCMGISMISDSRLDSYTEDLNVDFADITFNGELVAADAIRGTIYISQSTDMIHHLSDLNGKLDINNPKQELYFLRDDKLKELEETVTKGDYLTLIVVEDDTFCRINVAISTLPVISISNQHYGEFTETAIPVYHGEIRMFAGRNPGKGKMTIEEYSVDMHVRGGKSAKLSKKPWKLSLKKENGDNLDVDLLGMGADDDWILNPMNLDDTRLREKAAIDLWNDYIKDQSDYSMSSAQYVEVIVNGDYQGLYLLQRRIDAKYLQLDKKRDIIFKGRQTWQANTVYEGYEIVYTPYDMDTTYGLLQEYLYTIEESNYIDVNVFMEFLSASDNMGYKNMFYVLRYEGGTYKLYHVPWDTDISMGIIPSNGFINYYDYDASMNQSCRRMDYYNMLLEYPSLDAKMAERWAELRDTVFAKGGAWEQILEANIQCIMDSGAFERDNKYWGFIYSGEDTIEKLFQWREDRINEIDSYWE